MPRFGMLNHLLFDLQRHGHLSRVSILRSLGHSRETIKKALESGAVVRVARDWIATSSASQIAIVAVAHGGKLTGATALASYGIWDAVDRRIHVALRPNSHGTLVRMSAPIARFTAPRFPPHPPKIHWNREIAHSENESPWRVSVVDALVVVESESPPDQFVACVDSALNRRQISRAALPSLFAALPQRARRLLALVNGSAESGLESLARQRLAGVARIVETQVAIPGIGIGGGNGRVDLLLDRWLVIELDGDQFHDPKLDRLRNAVLVRLGYRIHRFGYDQVIFDWAGVEATVAELLRYPPGGARFPGRI
jgi:very-short-patch-repair endonuclease